METIAEFQNEFEVEEEQKKGLEKAWVWTTNQTERCFTLADVLSVSKDGEKTVVALKQPRHGKQFAENQDELVVESIPKGQVHLFDQSHLQDFDDAADMNNLNEAALMELLHNRFKNDKIYTLSGDVVISLNPYKPIKGLYERDILSKPKNEEPWTSIPTDQPHLFAVAEKAYALLCKGDLESEHAEEKEDAEVESKRNQSILINGESGAGKTEGAKYVMRYLAWQSESRSVGKHSHDAGQDGRASVEEIVLQSNPLLEAFGNARTVHNDNSSRFGKFVKVEYESGGRIVGAHTMHFLLETSRIVCHGEGERNYHIFYQICAALPNHVLFRHLEVQPAEYFSLLCPGHSVGSSEQDVISFVSTVEALQTIGLDDNAIASIWQVLCGILYLGNVEFETSQADTDHAAVCKNVEKSAKGVAKASELLGIPESDLCNALVTRTIGGRASVVTVPLTPEEARQSRDALAKSIYSRLFEWVLEQVNNASKHRQANVVGFIGVLDIFGFEVLERNSFEQICVNYSNEVLQKMFNEHVTALEEARYAQERISCAITSHKNNLDLLALLDGTRGSVFSLLEEQGMLGTRASDENYLAQLCKWNESNPYFVADKFNRKYFTVQHFAGPVQYSVEGFVFKNNDALQADLRDLMVVKSTNEFVCTRLFPMLAQQCTGSNEASERRERTGKKMARMLSVSGRFREQINTLQAALGNTTLHFVRCVKPNQNKQPGTWDAHLVLNQLRHLGVMEAVRIRQDGFPVQKSFKSLLGSFGELIDFDSHDLNELCAEDLSKRCDTLLATALGPQSKGELWQCGKKESVFLRKQVLPKLAAALSEKQHAKELADQEALRAQQELEAMHRRQEQEEKRKKAEEESQRALQERILEEEKARQEMETQLAEKEKLGNEQQARLEANRQKLEMQKELERQSATRVQAWWRKIVMLDRYARLRKARDPWKTVLRSNEAVLLASFVVHTSEREIIKRMGLSKFSNGALESLFKSKKRRALLLTAGPSQRLLCVDPRTLQVRAEIDARNAKVRQLQGERSFAVQETDDSGFRPLAMTEEELNGEGAEEETVWSFTDLLGRSGPWARAVGKHVSVADLMSFGKALRLDSTEPVVIQGYLTKRAIKSGKNWRKRWFVLQGNALMWFKSQRQSSPQGVVLLTRDTIIGLSHDRDHCFSLHSPTLRDGLHVQCESETSLTRWLAALSGVKSFLM